MSRILLIDDDPTLRRALRISLEKSGYEVLEAGEGYAGIAMFKARPADLVITDLIMPDMEGVETIQLLKKLNPHLPIIAISGGGRGMPDDYLRFAHTFGAARSFIKPFEFSVLGEAIAALLNEKSPSPPPPTR